LAVLLVLFMAILPSPNMARMEPAPRTGARNPGDAAPPAATAATGKANRDAAPPTTMALGSTPMQSLAQIAGSPLTLVQVKTLSNGAGLNCGL
jgi:hypothetical protein